MIEKITSLTQENNDTAYTEAATDEELREVFNNFWKPIVAENDKIDMGKVIRELHDYYYTLNFVKIVYNKLTGGRITSPVTLPQSVIAVVERLYDERLENEFKSAKDEFIDLIFKQGYFDHLDNKDQIKKELQNVVWQIKNEENQNPNNHKKQK